MQETESFADSLQWDEQLAVLQFHQATGLTVGQGPEVRDAELRARLMLEEAIEFANAVGYTPAVSEDGTITLIENGQQPDLVEAADALCDQLYVTFGAAVTFGLYLPQLFFEVHRSNMTKANGEIVRREDGKIEKPEGYEPPRLAPLIEEQRQGFEETKRQIEQFQALFAGGPESLQALFAGMDATEVEGIDNGDGTVEVPDEAA